MVLGGRTIPPWGTRRGSGLKPALLLRGRHRLCETYLPVFHPIGFRLRTPPSDRVVGFFPQGPPQYETSFADVTPSARAPLTFRADTEALCPPLRPRGIGIASASYIPFIKAMNPLVFRQEERYFLSIGPSSRKRRSDYCSPS